MVLLQKKNIHRDNYPFFSKKWVFGLVFCSGLVSCKSTDCGCPMALETKQEIVEPTKQEVTKQFYWKKKLKVSR